MLVNANIIFRRFLNSPLQWSEEVVTSLFVWTVFIGSAYAHRKHSHLGVDILVNVLPGKSKPIVQDIMSVVELLVLIMLTVVSSQYVYSLIFSRGALKIAMPDLLRVPKWWTGIAVPIG
ncbi:MAG: TRAP transporter small permease, partial [Dysosmobacter sp.]|nr:TRAP transporter small permease [Dysosmobacter sp.]